MSGCWSGKKIYENIKSADEAAKKLTKRLKMFIRSYRCNICGMYHVSKMSKKAVKERQARHERSRSSIRSEDQWEESIDF